jgi:hypothetical protein
MNGLDRVVIKEEIDASNGWLHFSTRQKNARMGWRIAN